MVVNQNGRLSLFTAHPLLALAAVLSLPAALAAIQSHRAAVQRSAVDGIILNRGEAMYDYQIDSAGVWNPALRPPGPEWLQRWPGIDFYCSVTGVSVYGGNLADAAVTARLNGLPGLRILWLRRCRNVDRGLEQVRGLRRLTHLSLSMCDLTDEGVKKLGGLRALRSLDLSATRVTDFGAPDLAELTALDALSVAATSIGDRGLASIASIVHLKSLLLDWTMVTDSGIEQLSALPELADLSIAGTKVSDAAVSRLHRRCPRCTIPR
jgi:hypothetical protein